MKGVIQEEKKHMEFQAREGQRQLWVTDVKQDQQVNSLDCDRRLEGPHEGCRQEKGEESLSGVFDHIDKFYSSKWFEDKLVINDVKLNTQQKGTI